MDRPSKCSMCFKRGSTKNKLNRHHIRGKKHSLIMWVHSETCHWFAQWVTNIYLQAGKELELDDKLICYLYQRAATLRHEADFCLPLYH